jgi:hypothetical protein
MSTQISVAAEGFSSRTLQAVFAPDVAVVDTWILNALDGVGGSVSGVTDDAVPVVLAVGENVLNDGATATLTAVPDATHTFLSWLKDGVDGGTENPTTITNLTEYLLYHATLTTVTDSSGSLESSVPIGGAVYLQADLSVSGLGPGSDPGAVYLEVAADKFSYPDNNVSLLIHSDGVTLWASSDDGVNYAVFNHFVVVTLTGSESVKALFDSENHIVTLWIDDVQVYSDTLTFTGDLAATSWNAPLIGYDAQNDAIGNIEATITYATKFSSRSIQPVFAYAPVAPTSLIGVCIPAKFGVAKFGRSKFGNYWCVAENELFPKILAATPPTFEDLKNKLKSRY